MSHWEIDIDSVGVGTVKLNGEHVEEDIKAITVHLQAGELSQVIVTYFNNDGPVKVEETKP